MNFSLTGSIRSVAILLLLTLGACAGTSDYMSAVPTDKADYKVEPDKAMVVFMRPSSLGFAVQSSVFDVTDGKPEFIGIVSAKKKIAHYTTPGQKRYMVIGESADFMGADLNADKVYYALVTPRMGLWKARFSLRPIEGSTVNDGNFKDWYEDTEWVEIRPSAKTWAAENSASINEKMNDYLPEWLEKSPKPVLTATDGQPQLYQQAAAK